MQHGLSWAPKAFTKNSDFLFCRVWIWWRGGRLKPSSPDELFLFFFFFFVPFCFVAAGAVECLDPSSSTSCYWFLSTNTHLYHRNVSVVFKVNGPGGASAGESEEPGILPSFLDLSPTPSVARIQGFDVMSASWFWSRIGFIFKVKPCDCKADKCNRSCQSYFFCPALFYFFFFSFGKLSLFLFPLFSLYCSVRLRKRPNRPVKCLASYLIIVSLYFL